jgi:hypothetical protein
MSTGHIPASLQRRVRLRANDRCEYCRIAQVGQEATFHVDHVTPRAAAGATSLENLALACVSCSLRKAARTTVIDPDTGDVAQQILGVTPTGRGTIVALSLNRILAVAIRREEQLHGRWP